MKKLLVLAVCFTAVIFGPVAAFGDELLADEMQPNSVSGKVYFVTLKRIRMTTEDCFYFNSSGDFSDLFGYLGTWKQLNLGILAVWKFEASDAGNNKFNMHGFQFLNWIWGSGRYDNEGPSLHLTARGELDDYIECPH